MEIDKIPLYSSSKPSQPWKKVGILYFAKIFNIIVSISQKTALEKHNC